jgi:hypothetical protein
MAEQRVKLKVRLGTEFTELSHTFDDIKESKASDWHIFALNALLGKAIDMFDLNIYVDVKRVD